MAKVVVVDDEPVWRDLCRECLQGLGHDVIAVGDGQHALELLTAEMPDLLILDLRMPVSGRSVLLAARRRRPNIPAIIYTAYSGYEDDPGLASANGFVVKSSDPTEFVSTVESLLRRKGLACREGPDSSGFAEPALERDALAAGTAGLTGGEGGADAHDGGG